MDLNGEASGEQGDVTEPSNLIPLEQLYRLCMKYYKENIGNAMPIPYKEKTYLLALHKQVTCGKYQAESGNEPGFLDVVGNDRKQAWQALGEMSKDRAMKEFIKVLHKCSPSLKPYLYAYNVQKEEEERQRIAEAERQKKAEEEAEKARQQAEESQRLSAGQPSSQQLMQEQQVRQALNQQTEGQFRAYAQSQFPGSVEQQDALIKQLQEQHFQQYVRQMYEQQLQQQQLGAGSPQAQSSSMAAAGQSTQQPGAALSGPTHDEQINGSHQAIVEHTASMWTQKDIVTFKNTIKKESKMENHTDCIIKVGSGETVTIRVPTHENGNCLFWEFATDHYDIAFGIYFEWTPATGEGIHLHVSDSSDDEDEEQTSDGKSDAEKGEGAAKPRGPPTDEIIPIYRRDSHEEVYCGSHVYPGRGVYLLKFDNSYSLWRSKTLYYRVYYSR
ncbi:hypothetical protein EB796_006404 [Bugula neritina]|uniref:ACBD3 n=1 Tax=Bugula neritina TaxID=10212 RepID=A0A7J7KCN4_BUGNE|nr:hypothetical protein EB796_006404 [Bugula neritina]